MGSSTDVAVTVPVPGVNAAFNTPFLSIVPSALLAVHVTPWDELARVARNRTLEPALIVIADGVTVTAIVWPGTGVEELTVINAVADLVESCIDAAVTVP